MLKTPKLPPLFSRAEARELGLTDRQISYRIKKGVFVAERRGQLRRADGPDLPYDVVAAARTVGGDGAVISHAAAARWYRLPCPLGGWGEPTLTVASGVTVRRAGVHLLVAPLADAEVRIVQGLAVTAPARTVADCLRALRPEDALAIADTAVGKGLTTVAELHGAVAVQAGWPGVVRARQVLEFVEGRRESPLESWSAWALAVEGVPAPMWQVDLETPAGSFVVRADAWWRCGLVGEADGRAKYRMAAAERGGASAEVLATILDQERGRAMRVDRLGADVLRWGAEDVRRAEAWRARFGDIRAV